MSRIISVIIQNSLQQNKNREEVKNREIRYLPDLSIFKLLSVFVFVQIFLYYHPNYPTRRLYFEEVEIHYLEGRRGMGGIDMFTDITDHRAMVNRYRISVY